MDLINNISKEVAFITDKKEIYTTSDTIAYYADVNYKSIQRIINNHIKELEEFGFVRFEITRTKNNRDKKIYLLNEEQATLLITFLKNTATVRKFKKELVKEFYKLKEKV